MWVINLQSFEAEIDTREDNFAACIALGKELLSREHYASADIKETLVSLNNSHNALLKRWNHHPPQWNLYLKRVSQ